jgi:predicted dithiol-disulfide oxidoreductase (DUF899 family)
MAVAKLQARCEGGFHVARRALLERQKELTWDEGGPSCSSLGDHIELPRVPLDTLVAYKERMDWTFPWVSSCGSDFNFDVGVSSTGDRPLLEDHDRADRAAVA